MTQKLCKIYKRTNNLENKKSIKLYFIIHFNDTEFYWMSFLFHYPPCPKHRETIYPSDYLLHNVFLIYSTLNTLGFHTYEHWQLLLTFELVINFSCQKQSFLSNLYSWIQMLLNISNKWHVIATTANTDPKISLGLLETARRINMHTAIFTACVTACAGKKNRN